MARIGVEPTSNLAKRSLTMYYSYDSIVDGFVDDFTPDTEAIQQVVVDTAEAYRGDYESIVNTDEDEFDNGVLNDFYEEVKREIALSLHICGLA